MAVKTYLEPEEIELLEASAEYLRDKLLVRLVFRLGCRISEALGIAVGDVDFVLGMITVEHLKTRIRLSCHQCDARLSRAARFCPECGARVEKARAEEKEHRRLRRLPLDNETLDLISEYIDAGGPVAHNGKQLLFGISRGHAWKIITDLADKAELGTLVNPETGQTRNISPHRLRDAFAIHAVKVDDSGDGLRLLQEHLGHQSITTTMKYRKIAVWEQKEWFEKLWA